MSTKPNNFRVWTAAIQIGPMEWDVCAKDEQQARSKIERKIRRNIDPKITIVMPLPKPAKRKTTARPSGKTK